MFLETSRLILRKFREEDFADYAVWRGDEEINRLMGNSLDVRQTFDWLKDHEERSYVLVLKETGRVIGDLTVCTVPADLAALEPLAGKRGVSLSFSISRDFRRRGLMTEALEAVIRRLFEEEGFDYIQCGYLDGNDVSAALQAKLGFTHLITQRFSTEHTESGEAVSHENVLFRASEHHRKD